MSHVDRMMWEYAAAEVEKDIKEGLEKSIKKAEKKAEKMKDKAKKSKEGEDAAAAKESANDANKLRKTVQKSIHKIDSAQDRNIHEEIGFRIQCIREIGHANPSRNGNAMIPKLGENFLRRPR